MNTAPSRSLLVTLRFDIVSSFTFVQLMSDIGHLTDVRCFNVHIISGLAIGIYIGV